MQNNNPVPPTTRNNPPLIFFFLFINPFLFLSFKVLLVISLLFIDKLMFHAVCFFITYFECFSVLDTISKRTIVGHEDRQNVAISDSHPHVIIFQLPSL